jgi:ABC-type multidrug transport system fused ATPase/permease subunit
MAMNAVERVEEFSELEQEPPAVLEDFRPPDAWPINGSVEFRNLSLKYAPHLPLVLTDLCFTIFANEKIGVVGRTGAGKSSLSMALFRILPFENGQIFIDGIDVSQIGLYDLRSRLTIIPQDPILFEGSLRDNLDPLHEHEDFKIWEAIGETGLLESLQTSSGDANLPQLSLDMEVKENGKNFSQGQRQILCLARAMLRSTKFIFMDEATASVDSATDARIQQIIRKQFVNGSVLTVAHRIKTVIDYDRILVLDRGRVAELDTPYNLLLKKGIFYQMSIESGDYEGLLKAAAESSKRRPLPT